MSIDNYTLRSTAVYDKAKLRVYLRQCRLEKKKAEFGVIAVDED